MATSQTAKAAEVVGQLYALMGEHVEDLCEPLSAITGHEVTRSTLDAWRAARETVPPEAADYLEDRMLFEEERLH